MDVASLAPFPFSIGRIERRTGAAHPRIGGFGRLRGKRDWTEVAAERWIPSGEDTPGSYRRGNFDSAAMDTRSRLLCPDSRSRKVCDGSSGMIEFRVALVRDPPGPEPS